MFSLCGQKREEVEVCVGCVCVGGGVFQGWEHVRACQGWGVRVKARKPTVTILDVDVPSCRTSC